jgi:hypothetical protein
MLIAYPLEIQKSQFSSVKHVEVTELTDNPGVSEFIILDR